MKIGFESPIQYPDSEPSGQTETVSVQFRPKISACFGFGISVFSLFGFRPKQPVSAEKPYFLLNLAAYLSKK